uniref:Uncharacterized protein n=1 Tax=Arundo donax TaxID=35708 RepID=A0A0A9C3D4_ARUDO
MWKKIILRLMYYRIIQKPYLSFVLTCSRLHM